MEEQWLNNLKERSKSFERKAPDGLWDGVMQSLEAKGVVKAKKKLSTIWLRWAVAAAAVLLPAVIGYVALNLGDVSMRQPVTSVEKVAALPLVVANDTALQSGVAAVQTNNLSVVAARKAAVKSQGDDEMAAVQPGGRQATAQQEQETERNEAADTVEAPQQDKRSTKSVMDDYADRYKDRKDSRKSLEFYGSNHGRNEAASKWSAGVYASNMAGNDASALGYRNFTMGVNPFAEMPREETWTTDAMANIMFNNIEKVPETKVKHHLPLRFGANVKYALTDRWGVESGVAYTLLKSELTSGGAQDYYAAEQTIHYFGIPLKVHFTVWQNDHFRAYANAGGMMEIPLSGKTETDYITNGQLSDSRTEDVDVDRLQWSVSGAVGFQYNFIENLGIYVEPGIGYYFDDGSDVLTVYKDKPLNFSLQVGVRLELK